MEAGEKKPGSRQFPARIVSGGQTGVDRAALDVAIYLELPHGGWCPLGRLAEDGPVPDRYELRETGTSDYAERTRRNVRDSDGTLVLHAGTIAGGTALTISAARELGRPLRTIHVHDDPPDRAGFKDWLADNRISVLNVAGPRESSSPGIGRLAERCLLALLGPPAGAAPE